jgi:hypothetical protein
VSQNGYLMSRRGGTLPANASGVDSPRLNKYSFWTGRLRLATFCEPAEQAAPPPIIQVSPTGRQHAASALVVGQSLRVSWPLTICAIGKGFLDDGYFLAALAACMVGQSQTLLLRQLVVEDWAAVASWPWLWLFSVCVPTAALLAARHVG